MNDAIDPLQGLSTFKARSNENMGMPPHATTGILKIPIRGKWAYGGDLFLRQIDPLPMEICAVLPGGYFMQGG